MVSWVNKVRLVIVCVLSILSAVVNAGEEEKAVKKINIDVYRSPSCGCCGEWIAHLEKNQFKVKDFIIEDVQAIKNKLGVAAELSSCHTALVDGYVIEGHVPASDIKKLLKLKPSVIGLSVPGMPVGTPGMEMGGQKDAYDVVSFDKEKKYKIFNHYGKNQ